MGVFLVSAPVRVSREEIFFECRVEAVLHQFQRVEGQVGIIIAEGVYD